MKDPIKIIKDYPGLELTAAFQYIIYNSTSLNAPYHNLHHCMRVMAYCNEACDYYDIKETERLNLLVSALFHDFSHSKGELSDHDNVNIAINGFDRFLDTDFYDLDRGKVMSLIMATEYPYTIRNEDLTLEQGIIRDADLMMGLDTDWFNTIVLGLSEEMHVNIKKLVAGNYDFHRNIVMATEWGSNVYNKNWEKTILKNLEILGSILNITKS